jgi:hypothetical protein
MSSRNGTRRSTLLYGLNQADEWWPFAFGERQLEIRTRFRELTPSLIRIFLYDKHGPDPITDWKSFRSYVDAVLDVGARPMITFAKMYRPLDDPRAIRWFAEQCADVVWSCLTEWGPSLVRDWYWAVWNEPNSVFIGGGLTFEQYTRIYTAVTTRCLRWLGPHLSGKRPLFGGPGIDTFQPHWLDWVYRFATEIDPSLVGFLDWHSYGEWRDAGDHGAPPDPAAFRTMMLWNTKEYEARARLVGQLTRSRGILNVCGENNAHSHNDAEVRRRFNYSTFNAVFQASSLFHLHRGGADAEMFWAGVDNQGGYGLLDAGGNPRPVFHAKRLAASWVRPGDQLTFPKGHDDRIETMVAEADDGRKSAFVVHLQDDESTFSVDELAPSLDPRTIIKIDAHTNGRLETAPWGGALTFHGYGVAVATNVIDPAL